MNDKKRTYEGMFVLPAGAGDFEAVTEPIRRILARNDAEILALKPWDERRLAYEIKGHRRGLYALAYFKAETSRIRDIEHDCQLNEQILRLLILRRDHLKQETIEELTPAMAAQRKAEAREREKAEQAATKSDEEQEGQDSPAETTLNDNEQAGPENGDAQETDENDRAETVDDNPEQAARGDAPPKPIAEGDLSEA